MHVCTIWKVNETRIIQITLLPKRLTLPDWNMLRTKSLSEPVTAGNKIKINDSRIVSILIVRTSRMKIFFKKKSLNFSRSFLPRFIVAQDLFQRNFLLFPRRIDAIFFLYRRKPWTWAFLNDALPWPPNSTVNFICHYFSTHAHAHPG